MKKEVKHLYAKALESLTLSIELFNRPNDVGRTHGVLIFMDHSFEMLLKAAILHRGGKIRERGKNETIGFSACVRRGYSDGEIKFLNDEQVLTLQTLNGLRDAAQHHILEMSEQYLYFQAQAGLTLFRDIAKEVFDYDLKTALPNRVLPLSTSPPTDINEFFSSEVGEIKKLLVPRSRKRLEAVEKLKALAIMENSIQGIDTQPSGAVLQTMMQRIKEGRDWSQIFPGVSTLSFTANGYGPSLDLRIVKQEGIPVEIVPEGTPGEAVISIKRVNELDFYNLGRDQLAKKIGVSGPKTTAAVYCFGIKEDSECFKQIRVGKSIFDRYSPKTINKIKEKLKEKSIDEVWIEYKERER